MNGYTMRQGTVYRHRADGTELLVFHHDPMRLRSLALRRVEGEWDAAHPAELTVDTLIAMRRSGEFDDLGDLAAAERRAVLDRLLALPALPEDDRRLLQSLRDEAAEA